METLLPYFFKSAALMGAFFIAYHILLRRETFFKSNRWYLLAGLVTSMVLPLVTFKKVVWVDPIPQQVVWSNIPASALSVSGIQQPQPFVINWYWVIAAIYAIGVIVLLTKFVLDFYALRKLLKGKTIQQQADYKFVDVAENVAPFSYFSFIVYNSSLYNNDELVNIIEHEKVHSAQQHTIDVLLARLVCIAFWWNPFVWLYKKAILQNLEFIADSEATKNIPDKKAYQFTLLKITTHESCVAVTNHFYQSLIKKRIVMLNKNQSNKWNSWKYVLIIPALAAFFFYFQVKVVAQERPGQDIIAPPPPGHVDIVVDKNTSDAELKEHSERLKKEEDIKLKFSKVKRNGNGEIIAIKAEFKDKSGKKGVTQLASDNPIDPIHFFKGNDGAIGFGRPKRNDVHVYVDRDEHRDEDRDENHKEFKYDYNYNYNYNKDRHEDPERPEGAEAPEAPEPPEALDQGNMHLLKDEDGMVISINGDDVNIDVAKIVADAERQANEANANIDLHKITADALKQASDQLKKLSENADARDAMKRAGVKMDMKLNTDKARAEMEQTRAEMASMRAEMAKLRAEVQKDRAKAKAKQSK